MTTTIARRLMLMQQPGDVAAASIWKRNTSGITRWLRIMVARATEATMTIPADGGKTAEKGRAAPARVAGLHGDVEGEIFGAAAVAAAQEQPAQGDGDDEGLIRNM